MFFLKKFIPNSIFSRFLLIIALPSIVVQIVAIYVFYYSHIDEISKHMARGVISEMAFIKKSINSDGSQALVKEFSKNVGLDFVFYPGKKLSKKAKIVSNKNPNIIFGFLDLSPVVDPLNRYKIELKNSGFTPFAIHKNPDDDLLTIKVELSDGVLNFYVQKKRITSSTKYIFTIWMVVTSLLMSFISIIFLKNQIRSIKDLNIVTEKFGRGYDTPDFKPSGADEIKSVGISFIKMKERIVRQISQRTDMLSGVSHDLRTPLTRMKLQLEMMSDSEAVQELKLDISDMEKMINEYLEFSAGGVKEENQNIRIKGFLEEIILYYKKSGKEIGSKINFSNQLEIVIKPNSLKRVIRNLIDNALGYGKKVVLSADISGEDLKIIIDDDGPGVPEFERENIFKPFYRIDNSRNLDKIGTGLGLAIVLDLVTSHGGKVDALDSPLGGLRIVVRLPK